MHTSSPACPRPHCACCSAPWLPPSASCTPFSHCDRVVHTDAAPSDHNIEDYGTLRPLARDRIVHHFGTDRPSPGRFEELLAQAHEVIWALPPAARQHSDTLLDECRMRWTGVYVVLYTDEQPTHVGIFGYSGD
ncbi:hypothetical protein ABT009_14110 [Streptomyces sp. NPDC002896]|uniref:hypothetical protein n=1 Tax=Streptomyces sp. NPDC002896 TaxID=3154438 RepID=UPI003317661A